MNINVYKKEKKKLPWSEQVIKMVSGEVKRYKRIGKCVRCGACCKNEICSHFKILDNGKAYCDIHKSKNRPNKCKWFPQVPPIIFKTCGYSFVDLADRRIIKPGESP